MKDESKTSDGAFKAHANGRNKCQQLPTLLGVVGQQCCVRLHGPKSLTGFKLHAKSANKCQHCCGSMQTDATSHNTVGPNNIGCCWPKMLGPFAWAFTDWYVLFVCSSDHNHARTSERDRLVETPWQNSNFYIRRLVLKKKLFFCVGEYAEYGFYQQRLI